MKNVLLAKFFRRMAAFAACAGLAAQVFAGPAVHTNATGVAAGGADVVAYSTMGKSAPGDAKFNLQHDGATYLFASAENRATFNADPTKYAPQYCGYCAYAASFGKKAPGDAQFWKLVDGKLYLNYNADVQGKWSANTASFITKADGQWVKIKNN
jgi:YHS domain-containing protein